MQRVKLLSWIGETVSKIDMGLLVLLGIYGRYRKDMDYIAEKCVNPRISLRIQEAVMNLSVKDVAEKYSLFSQFSHGDARKGRRQTVISERPPDTARDLFERCVFLF